MRCSDDLLLDVVALLVRRLALATFPLLLLLLLVLVLVLPWLLLLWRSWARISASMSSNSSAGRALFLDSFFAEMVT
jgi:hypothetical protein